MTGQHMKVADQVLVDAKPAQGCGPAGGNGLAFDWRLMAGRRWPVPWMLAGGLTPDNVAEAIAVTGARQVDVASGVKSRRGSRMRPDRRILCGGAGGLISRNVPPGRVLQRPAVIFSIVCAIVSTIRSISASVEVKGGARST